MPQERNVEIYVAGDEDKGFGWIVLRGGMVVMMGANCPTEAVAEAAALQSCKAREWWEEVIDLREIVDDR